MILLRISSKNRKMVQIAFYFNIAFEPTSSNQAPQNFLTPYFPNSGRPAHVPILICYHCICPIATVIRSCSRTKVNEKTCEHTCIHHQCHLTGRKIIIRQPAVPVLLTRPPSYHSGIQDPNVGYHRSKASTVLPQIRLAKNLFIFHGLNCYKKRLVSTDLKHYF